MVWNDPKMKNKLLEISSFYTCVPKTTIIRGTVPEIRSETDRIFCHFGPFFALLPPNNPQNQNFEKMKKKTVYVFILHMSIKNHDYICFLRYGVQQKQFFVILGHVLAFYPTIDPENYNLEKM